MTEDEEKGIPKRPWRVEVVEVDEDRCGGIYAADGKRVVETDYGFYPPNLETARFIVKCVNEAGYLYEDGWASDIG